MCLRKANNKDKASKFESVCMNTERKRERVLTGRFFAATVVFAPRLGAYEIKVH